MASPYQYHITYASSGDIGGKTSITINPGDVDNSTSLELPGRGKINYGEFYDKNVLNLLENFAKITPPLRPTIGQIWFNTASSKLNYYDGLNNNPSFPGWTIILADDACADPLFNTKFGCLALHSVTTGTSNNAFGNHALTANTTGSSNNAYGLDALVSNTIGGRNNGYGLNALYGNISGNRNNAYGAYALSANVSGNNNTVVGDLAGGGIITGSGNTIIGANVVSASDTSNYILIGSGDGTIRIKHDGTTLFAFGSGGVNATHFTATDNLNTQFGGNATIGYYQDGTNTAIRTTAAGTIYFQSAGGSTEFGHMSSSGLTLFVPINSNSNIITTGNVTFRNQRNTDGHPVTAQDFGGGSAVALGFGSGVGTMQRNDGANYTFTIFVSDESLKENIKPSTEYSLAKIDEIDFISFTYGEQAGTTFAGQQWKCGVSAQQLQTVEPEWVREVPGGYLQPDDSKLLVASLQAIQELSALVRTLQVEVEILKAK